MDRNEFPLGPHHQGDPIAPLELPYPAVAVVFADGMAILYGFCGPL
jgi:hypothetical protein